MRDIRGRVASLLEVGTGFHPELTGRENIQLNGAILGMTRAEINSTFDDIVEFVEIGRFLDTPVKRYSSGMYVRLAFAVAAHLDPEILIVDEVLAVGDAEFQRKCLGKMSDVAHGGRTVVFVSHNLQAVRALCSRVVLLDAWRLTLSGTPDDVVREYIGGGQPALTPSRDLRLAARTMGSGDVRVVDIELADAEGRARSAFAIDEPLVFTMHAECPRHPVLSTSSFLLIRNPAGDVIVSTFEYDSSLETRRGPDSSFAVSVTIDSLGLAPGLYTACVGVLGARREMLDWVDYALPFEVRPAFCDGRPFDHRLGEVTVRGLWQRL